MLIPFLSIPFYFVPSSFPFLLLPFSPPTLILELPRTRLSDWLEVRIRRMVKPDTPPVMVRVLSIRDKAVEVRAGVRAHYADSAPLPETLPYKAKAVYVFQRIDEVDVCFFG